MSSSRGVHPRQDGMLTRTGSAVRLPLRGQRTMCHTLNPPAISTSQPRTTAGRGLYSHLRRTPRYGTVITEFLRDVPWSGPHGTINAAFGHHAAGRSAWLRHGAIMDNYSMFWFRHPKAVIRYTWWPAWSAFKRFRLDGRREMLRALYPHLRAGVRSVGQSLVRCQRRMRLAGMP